MTAVQWFALAALILIGLTSLAGIVHMLATEACRRHYERAGVAWTSHVNDALEVTR